MLLATNNRGKLKEFSSLFADLPVRLVLPQDIGLDLSVEENGCTYFDNARLKAGTFSRAARMIALADDSGLEVEALGNLPGLHSNRFAGEDLSDADRRRYLLERLNEKRSKIGPPPWKAHFHCTIVIVTPEGAVYSTEGDCQGGIIEEERGSNGFGYDPIFLVPEYGCTMAELTMVQKNQVSHRALAARAAMPLLRKIYRIP